MTIALLLIESDARQAQALIDAVMHEGLPWHIVLVQSLEQGRRALERAKFELVLVRHDLADGCAVDLLQRFPDQTMILCIAQGQEAQAARALEQGFSDFVVVDPAGRYV